MTLRREMITPTLVLALAVATLLAIVGLWGLDGQPLVSAQTDTTAPTVSSVSISSDTGDTDSAYDDDGVYGIGDSIEITVTFSEDIAVTGTPQLELDIGGSARTAGYERTNGSIVVFSYTVAKDDSDDDGIAVGNNKLTLNGGTIKDMANNGADLSHGALSAQTNHKVDGIRPTVSSVILIPSSDGDDGAYTVGELITAGVEFSEDVIVTGNPQLELDFEGSANLADFAGAIATCGDQTENTPWPAPCLWLVSTSNKRGIELIFDYTVSQGDQDNDGVAISANAISLNGGAIKDAAGNDAVLSHDALADDSDFIVSVGGL